MDNVVISEPQNVSLDQELQQQKSTTPQQDQQLLLGKFKSVEDLAEAYKNLEKKLGVSDRIIETPEQAQEIVTKSGLNFSKYEEEFYKLGRLSENSLQELEKAGISKNTVDYYIQGQQALAEKILNDVYSSLGGESRFKEIVEWANNNLSDEEVETFNKIVDTGDLNMIKLTLKGLQAKYLENNNSFISQNTFITNNNSNSMPFRSWQEVSEAMSDRRYGKDPAYTKDIERRISISRL